MLTMFGIFSLASAAGVFLWTLRKGIFRRYPWKLFILLAITFLLGVVDAIERPSILNRTLLLIDIVALAAALLLIGVGIRFPRNRVSVRSGQRLPSFTLPDSTGQLFRSESLEGETAVLYLFYRGHW